MRKLASLLAVLMLLSTLALAQTRTISGQIKDERGEPVPFASIEETGTRVATKADANGFFSIKIKEGSKLTVTAVGFETLTLTPAQNVVSINLTTKTGQLQEVVVTTALGIKRPAKEVGYSTTRVSGGEVNQAKVTNIANGLTAKVAGLQINTVNNSVKPDVRVTLRGNRSILGNNQALLVVDDIILPINYLNSLNPNDVESVNVLKGASASALYGSAASNGVIIITTRRGTKGRPVIRVSSTATVEEVSFMPKLQNRFGPDGGENSFAFPGVIQFPENPFLWYVPYENQSYGPEFNGQPVTIGGPVRIYSPDGTSFIDSTLKGAYVAQPDAKKKFFDKGLTLQQDVSYSAGDEKSRFYLSFQDVNVKGIVPKDESHRNTFRINGSRETGRFRADYNVGYTILKANTTPGSGVPFNWGNSDFRGGYTGGGSYFQNRPVYWTVINTPANINLRDYKDWQTNPFASPDGYFNAYYGNPWWQIDQTRLDERSNDFLGSASLSFRPINAVNILYRFSLAHNDYNNKYTQAGYTFADWAKADPLGAGNIPSSVQKLNPSEGDGFSVNQRVISDLLISGEHKFFNDLDAKLILGNQVQSNYFRASSMSASALVIPDFYNISNRIGEPAVGETKVQTRLYGIFGDLTLGWKDYLFVHGSVRNDWTSLLSSDNRSYLYPAVDVAFLFTELLKDKLPSWLNYGKLRGAYSKTAQVSIGAYSLQNTFNLGAGFPYSNAAGFTVGNSYANPEIKPEFTKDREIGLELGLWNNRINFNAAYFNDITNNQTIPISISSSTGFTTAFVNSGEMSNKGFEVEAKITPLLRLGKDFRWDIGGNFSYIKNEVLSIGYGLNEVFVGGSSYAVVGSPYPVIKTTDWKRDDQEHIIVSKLNGLPTIDPTQKYFGTTNPPYRIGLSTTVTYKGFTLNVLADGRFGAVIFNSIGSSLDFTGVSWYSAQSGRQAFVLPNSVVDDGTGKYVPNTAYSVNDGNNLFWASTWNAVGSNYVTSADFWKLREVSLIYDIPKSAFKKVNAVKAISLGLVGRNLYTWKPKQNVWTDPEFSNTNGNGIGTNDINQTPPTRFYGGNVTITF